MGKHGVLTCKTKRINFDGFHDIKADFFRDGSSYYYFLAISPSSSFVLYQPLRIYSAFPGWQVKNSTHCYAYILQYGSDWEGAPTLNKI